MSCKFCDVKSAVGDDDVPPYGGYTVGEWAFEKKDTLLHNADGRISLWYDFDPDPRDSGWTILVLIDETTRGLDKGFIPSVVQLKPKVCPFCGRELVKPKWLWRLESVNPSNGLWYDSEGRWVLGVAGCSTEGLPMGYDWRYRQDGKSWWSSCSRRDDLTRWYSKEDAAELTGRGFVFTRYYATEYHEYEGETVFLKESCLAREELTLEEVFGEWA